jgi:hypothetical protein
MVKPAMITVNGRHLVRTYSDEGRTLVRDGITYGDAIDPADSGRVYTEGDFLESEEVTAEEALAELVEVLE